MEILGHLSYLILTKSPTPLMRKFIPPLLFLLALVSCQAPKNEAAQETHLGVLKHPFNVSDVANESFTRGLLLLHSFEYSDALKAFQEAAQHAFPVPQTPYWIEISNAVYPELQAAILGDKTSKQALDDAAAKATQILEDGGAL